MKNKIISSLILLVFLLGEGYSQPDLNPGLPVAELSQEEPSAPNFIPPPPPKVKSPELTELIPYEEKQNSLRISEKPSDKIVSDFQIRIKNAFENKSRKLKNQYIVRFKDSEFPFEIGKTENFASSLLHKSGVTIEIFVKSIPESQTGEIFTIFNSFPAFSAFLSNEQANELRQRPDIEYVVEDEIVEGFVVSPSPSWGLDRVNQLDLPLDDAHSIPRAGNGVHIYVLDSGLRITHEQFKGRVGSGYNAFNLSTNPVDDNGHGTHVSGIISGTDYGIAKGATIHPVKVLDSNNTGPWTVIIEGLEWVRDNHKTPGVVNMSLGGLYDPANPYQADIENLIVELVDVHNLTVVVSAGNSVTSSSLFIPARIPEVITVAATDISDNIANYSNNGSIVDIFAPGGEGQDVSTAIKSSWLSSDTSTRMISGTSMASPLVAGVVAIYASTFPGDPYDVENGLESNAVLNTIVPTGLGGAPNLMLFTGNSWISRTIAFWWPFSNLVQFQNAESEGWFWTSQTGWVHITQSNYPYIYFASDGEYHYYSENTNNPAWF